MTDSLSPSLSPDVAPRSGATTSTRDGFLDAVKAIALWRVVVWHALAWPWLSWFAAMPAMFYVAGVLLQHSLDRHGHVGTLRSRIPRLLTPFWAFGAVAVALMVAAGWRPGFTDLVWWVVPLGDPGGLDAAPGLWIPLWYLRAYLWVVLAGGALSWLCRRTGTRALLVPLIATAAVWAWQGTGHDVPLAVADAALFPFFVMAGMLTATGQLDLDRRRAAQVGSVAFGVAVVWYLFDGAPMGIVNGSLPLHLLVGVATISALTAVRGPLSRLGPATSRFVAWSSSRALTVYLWHGLGLLVADRLVHGGRLPGPLALALGLGIVVVVTVACTVAFGRLEDRAAHRAPRRAPRLARVAFAPGCALVVVALVMPGSAADVVRMVPSGQAVMARTNDAEIAAGDLADRGASSSVLDRTVLDAVFDDWLADNRAVLDELDTELIEVALVDGNDEVVLLQWTRSGEPASIDPFPWWSMSKTMTAAWMMQLADQGVIELDGSLIDHLASVPHSDEFTFEQLAGHRSGVPSSLDGDLLTATPIDEIGAYFDSPDLAYVPGEGYDYSRVGYYLLTWGLEQASGSTWRAAMEGIAAEAGATLIVDEDLVLSDRVTHPGSGTYRGSLWGAGGLHGTTVDGAKLFRWTLMEGLDESAVRTMAMASPEHHAYYGLGLMPFCPCVSDGDLVSSDRVGLSTITGSYVVDLATDVGLMLRTDNWWSDEGPALEFDDLIRALLDAASG